MARLNARRRLTIALLAAAVIGSLSAPAPGSAAGGKQQSLLAACSLYALEVAPAQWSPGCTGGSAYYEEISWQGWGEPLAVGTGQVQLNDCDPSCAEGTAYTYPATLQIDQRSPCPTKRRAWEYTRVRSSETLPGGNPFGLPAGPHTSTWHVGSGECNVYVPIFEQGTGIVLEERPRFVDARRNIRPGSISGLDVWGGLRWRRWGGEKALALGQYFWHSPDGSRLRRFAARVVLQDRRKIDCYGSARYFYTRIHGVFLGPKPAAMGRHIRLRTYRYTC